MKVYRMEDADGKGPWSGGKCYQDYTLISYAGTWPGWRPPEGFYWAYHKHWQFACVSTAQLEDWWPTKEARKYVVKYGGRFAVYEAENVIECQQQTQCIFDPVTARLVGKLHPVTLEEKGLDECLELFKETSPDTSQTFAAEPKERPLSLERRRKFEPIPGWPEPDGKAGVLKRLSSASLSSQLEEYSKASSSMHGLWGNGFAIKPSKALGTDSTNPASLWKTPTKTGFGSPIGRKDKRHCFASVRPIDWAQTDSTGSTEIEKLSWITSTETAIPFETASPYQGFGNPSLSKLLERLTAGPTTRPKTNTTRLFKRSAR